MPITTNALNYMINNVTAQTSLWDLNVMALTFSTPTQEFNSASMPTNIMTDLVPCTFGTASGGVRTLSSDIVLTTSRTGDARYLAIYSRTEEIVPPDRDYDLVAYVDITEIELTSSPPSLVTIKATVTSIGLANT